MNDENFKEFYSLGQIIAQQFITALIDMGIDLDLFLRFLRKNGDEKSIVYQQIVEVIKKIQSPISLISREYFQFFSTN